MLSVSPDCVGAHATRVSLQRIQKHVRVARCSCAVRLTVVRVSPRELAAALLAGGDGSGPQACPVTLWPRDLEHVQWALGLLSFRLKNGAQLPPWGCAHCGCIVVGGHRMSVCPKKSLPLPLGAVCDRPFLA